MHVSMSKSKQKKYLKELSRKIYAEEYGKERAKVLKKQRASKIEEIKKRAKEDAQIGGMGTTGRIGSGIRRMQRGAERIQQKRVELSKMVSPYVKNLEDTFDMSKIKKKPPLY